MTSAGHNICPPLVCYLRCCQHRKTEDYSLIHELEYNPAIAHVERRIGICGTQDDLQFRFRLDGGRHSQRDSFSIDHGKRNRV